MPQILVNVSGEQKELWVGAAHDERVSLSEWIRRRCDDGLGAGAPGVPTPPAGVSGGGAPARPAPAPSPSFPQSVREFKPDPKKGGSK